MKVLWNMVVYLMTIIGLWADSACLLVYGFLNNHPPPITNTLLKVVPKIKTPIYSRSLPYLPFLLFSFFFFFWSLSYFYKFNLVKNDWNLSSTFSILLNALFKINLLTAVYNFIVVVWWKNPFLTEGAVDIYVDKST